MDQSLSHYGIKGMKWGIRRFQKKDGTLTPKGKRRYSDFNYAAETTKSIKINSDGSKTIPPGFAFNRVGRSSLDINKSGGLYVSYGKEDAARYVRTLGPTFLGKLLGTSSDTIQHISVKESLRMPSDSQTAAETAKLLMSNKKLLREFNESIYSLSVTGDYDKQITASYLDKAIRNPSGKDGQKLAYGVSSFLGDEQYAPESKIVYEHFRKKGYDAIPDIHDRLGGVSNTALIIINPKKVNLTSTTTITKDVMKSGKAFVKTLNKLKISDLID